MSGLRLHVADEGEMESRREELRAQINKADREITVLRKKLEEAEKNKASLVAALCGVVTKLERWKVKR